MTKETDIRVLGIDPGMRFTGFSFLSYDRAKGKTTVNEYGTFCADALTKKENGKELKIYGNIITLETYEREFNKLFEKYKPQFVVSESAFYNPKMPNAFLSLSLCINTMKRVLRTHGQVLYTVAPKEAKQCVATGIADKVAVQDGIHKHDDLIIKHTKANPIEKMVEHEADSCAIGYTFIKNYLNDILMIQEQQRLREMLKVKK